MLHTVLDGFLQRICGLYRELGTEIPLEFESVGHDLSQQRMQYVEAAYEQAVEEKVGKDVTFIVLLTFVYARLDSSHRTGGLYCCSHWQPYSGAGHGQHQTCGGI